MYKMLSITCLAALCASHALGCSPDSANQPTRAAPASTRAAAGAGASVREGCGTPGVVPCYCDDGSLRGVQTCHPNGTLTLCACTDPVATPVPADATAASAQPTGPPSTPNSDNALCPDLQGEIGCVAESYQSTELPANVLFLVDRSGSMACNPPPLQDSAACEMQAAPVDGTQPSKWQITTEELGNVFDDLLAQHASAKVGLTFFSNDNSCGVQSKPTVALAPLTSTQTEALKNALALVTPNGGTPLVGATTLAYAYLHQEAGQRPGCAEPCGAAGNRYVVVITDGADSCPSPERPEDQALCTAAGSCTNYLVQQAAKDAARANIKTFVIGAPGSEPARGYLSELAFVGGTARNGGKCTHDPSGTQGDCHFDMTGSQDFRSSLSAALGSISGAALGCEFAVPQTNDPVDEHSVNVQYRSGDGEPSCLKYDERSCDAGADGWQFAKQADGTRDSSRVVICGPACDAIRQDAQAHVDVVLGCQTINLE